VRGQPVAVVGRVNILAPTGSSAYFRLTWTQADGSPGRTSGSTTLEAATSKATGIDGQLRLAAGDKTAATLAEVVADYTSTVVGRNHKTGRDWSKAQLKQVTDKLNRCLRGYESRQALSVDRELLDLMRRASGTRNSRKENASVLRGLIRWGYTAGYFTAGQAELLPTNLPDLDGLVAGTAAPRRGRNVRAVGQTETYIREEDAPSKDQVTALGNELDLRFPAWGRLCAELAAAAGCRWGEQFQLTARHVLEVEAGGEKNVSIVINHQVDGSAARSKGENPRTFPKGNKQRVTPVTSLSFTGFPVRSALVARAAVALAEQAAGTNEEALLFPTKGGRMWHHTAFYTKVFGPAALAAGWPSSIWSETRDVWCKENLAYKRVTRPRVQLELTWHSLRHRFARTAIDVHGLDKAELMSVGGWENETIVSERYYRSGAEHAASAAAKMR